MSRTLASLAAMMVLAWCQGCGPAEGQASTTEEPQAFPPVRIVETTATPAPAASTTVEIPEWVKTRVAEKIDKMMSDFDAVRSLERRIRSQLELFEKHKGQVWSPGSEADHAWGALVGRYLREAPANPFSPGGVATHVVVVNERGVTGDAVSPREAGWVWNATDEILFAARDAAAMRACAREEDRRVREERAGPLLRPKLTTLRAQINFYMAYEGRSPWADGNLAKRQWKPLINRGYLSHPPMNPMVPREVSTRIVEVRESGLTGTSIDPATAAWVWNSVDNKIYAAGFDGSL